MVRSTILPGWRKYVTSMVMIPPSGYGQHLVTPRTGSPRPWPTEFRAFITRIRRRIETVLSVLSVVFHIEQPGFRSLSGLVARTSSRILAYTLAFLTAPLLAFFGFQSQN